MTTPMPMLDEEDAAAYTCRTGAYPPDWSVERCQRQDALLNDWREVERQGIDPAGRADARRKLARWGALDD